MKKRGVMKTIGREKAITILDSIHESMLKDGSEYAEAFAHGLNVFSDIEVLSELRSLYNCFDPKEESVYHALSEAIRALAQPEQKIGKWIYDGDEISRKDAIKQIQKYGVGCFDEEDFTPEQCERFVISLLENLPSVQSEQKTGKWVVKHGEINCSVCKKCKWSYSFIDLVSGFAYCPRCGAKMKQGD